MRGDSIITHTVEEDAYSYIICFLSDPQVSEPRPLEHILNNKAIMWICTTDNLKIKRMLLGSVKNVIDSEIRDFRQESFLQFIDMISDNKIYILRKMHRDVEFYIRQRIKQLASKI